MGSEHQYDQVLSDAAERAIRYLDAIRDRRVFPSQEALNNLRQLGGALPDQGQPASSVLKALDELGSPATVATMGSRYFGFVVGGAFPASVAAHWLADA